MNYIDTVKYLYDQRKQKLIDWLQKHTLRQVQWEATRRCDMKCLHCGSPYDSKNITDELKETEIINAFDSIANDFKIEEIELVNITGGEPLIRSDLLDIISHLYSFGFKHITIQTNGNPLINNEKLIERLSKSGLSGIGLNLDGLSKKHDWQRNMKGHFDKIFRLAKFLVEKTDFYITITTVVNRFNYFDINELYEVIQEIHPKRWRLIEIQPLGRAHKNRELLLSVEQYKKLLKFVYDINQKITLNDNGRDVKVELGCSGWLGSKYEGIVRPYIWHCQAGISTLGIWHDGSIGGCTDIDHFFSEGNVRENSISKIWEDGFKVYRDWSARKNGECSTCNQWEWCHGGPFHLRTPNNDLLNCTYKCINMS
ncbi:MAG: radical SAM protein [Candidatus Aminicenantes bacterium]|jgi:radical SAM protein with 4Fe4S-binding SPASM domain